MRPWCYLLPAAVFLLPARFAVELVTWVARLWMT